jgi:NAD(P)-dependent dehydrogenase (short-subunit alcohol dehydrogenase family)
MGIFDLSGRRALVTGSSRGIGLALARGLAEAGAAIVLNGRDQAKLAAVASEISGAQILAFDVTDHAASRLAVDAFEAEHGAIDILVNNAGMQFRAPLEDFPADAFMMLLQTNVASVFNVGQACARHMISRKAGKIINIASRLHWLVRRLRHIRPPRAPWAILRRACAPTGPSTGYSATPSRQAISIHRSMPRWSRILNFRAGSRGVLQLGVGARWKNWSAPVSSWRPVPRVSSTAIRSMSMAA